MKNDKENFETRQQRNLAIPVIYKVANPYDSPYIGHDRMEEDNRRIPLAPGKLAVGGSRKDWFNKYKPAA